MRDRPSGDLAFLCDSAEDARSSVGFELRARRWPRSGGLPPQGNDTDRVAVFCAVQEGNCVRYLEQVVQSPGTPGPQFPPVVRQRKPCPQIEAPSGASLLTPPAVRPPRNSSARLRRRRPSRSSFSLVQQAKRGLKGISAKPRRRLRTPPRDPGRAARSSPRRT